MQAKGKADGGDSIDVYLWEKCSFRLQTSSDFLCKYKYVTADASVGRFAVYKMLKSNNSTSSISRDASLAANTKTAINYTPDDTYWYGLTFEQVTSGTKLTFSKT